MSDTISKELANADWQAWVLNLNRLVRELLEANKIKPTLTAARARIEVLEGLVREMMIGWATHESCDCADCDLYRRARAAVEEK